MYTPSRYAKTKQRDEYQNHNKQHEDIYPEAENTEELIVDENMSELYEQEVVDRYSDQKDPEAHFHRLMWGQPDARKAKQRLPEVIKINDPLPDELPFMRKRQYPQVLRFHKANMNNNPIRFFQSEVMLYYPHWSEDLFQMSDEEVTQLYKDKQENILFVKKQVMEHLEDVEEARHFVAEANKKLDLQEIAEELDPVNEQENDDLEGDDEQNPEYQHLDPGQEDEPREASIYRRIELPDPKVLWETTRGLDQHQRFVVDQGVRYARDLRKAEKPENKTPKPPHLMVHGGAGAGKTTVIKTLVQHIELILRKTGDESEAVYVIKTAPTGAAASLIEGMTLHRAFNFDFRGRFHSLSDRIRDQKRTELRNLKVVIIDEVSMVKAELLYQLDLRLQEIKERPGVPFGGVALMCFGDIMQLRPVMGSYIFQRPNGDNFQVIYDLASRWHMLKVVNLEVNHRQGGDKTYADLLNRMRTGSLTKQDMNMLKSRIRKKGHPVYKEVALYIVCTKLTAQNINNQYLDKMPGEEIILKATHTHALQKQYKPWIDNVGNVGKTGFSDKLKLKVGCKVMLIHNIDVADCLTNGQLGTLIGILKKDGHVMQLIIEFNNENVGKISRQKHPQIAARYPKGTGIKKVSLTYSLTDRSRSNITVIQYPIKPAFAVTAHKIQGQSIPRPHKVALEINATFTTAQAYVMFGSVEEINQMIIMDTFTEANIKTDPKAILEMHKMNERSVNNNPSPWMKRSKNTIKIVGLNVMNLVNNMKNVEADPTLGRADIINLSETWITSEDQESELLLKGYQASFNNAGRGKGIVSFFKQDVFGPNAVTHHQLPGAQITKLGSEKVDIIHVYRSQDQCIAPMLDIIYRLVDSNKTTVICGDFNICLKKTPNNTVTQQLTDMKMEQLNKEATHIAGGHIDHMYLKRMNSRTSATLERYAPYYTDHDALCLTLDLTSLLFYEKVIITYFFNIMLYVSQDILLKDPELNCCS